MSDASGDKDISPEAEVLGPEKDARAAPSRKEPPVIEGEAEVLASSTGGGGSDDGGFGDDARSTASSADAPAPGKAASRASGLGAIAIAVVLSVVAAGVIAYVAVGRLGSTTDMSVADLGARIEALEQKNDDSDQTLTETTKRLDGRLAAAEATLAAQAPESIGAVNARLDKLTAETEALKQSLADTQAAAQAGQKKLDEIATAMPPAGLADQVAKIEAMLRLLNGALDQLTPKIAAMDARLAALEAKKEDPDAAARAALGLALANLARAAEGAGPFRSELDAVATFLPNEPELTRLAPVADKGATTRARLKEEFTPLVQAIFDAERSAEDDGLWTRFVSNIRSVVTVRRTGEISGQTTEAVVARMEERLKVDDLAGAVEEGARLKGKAEEAAKPWLDRARARLDTDDLVRDLSARVASRLAKAADGTAAGGIGD